MPDDRLARARAELPKEYQYPTGRKLGPDLAFMKEEMDWYRAWAQGLAASYPDSKFLGFWLK